jgi:hypothetical protein
VMIHLLNPAWLWGLGALLIPLAIHLLSKKPGKLMPFGSIRFLTESTSSKFRGFHPDELVLLALRCALVALLIIFLSGIKAEDTPERKLLFIEAGLEGSAHATTIRDSLLQKGYDLVAGIYIADYWGFAERLSGVDAVHIVVITRQAMTSFKGERAVRPVNVTWIPVEPESVSFDLFSFSPRNDSMITRTGSSDTRFTSYHYGENGKTAVASQNDTVRVRLVSAPEFTDERKIIVAALRSVETISPCTFDILSESDRLEETVHWTICLGVTPNNYDNVIALIPSDNKGGALIQRDTDGRKVYWRLTRRLTPTEVISENFIPRLKNILLHNRYAANERDVRMMPDEMAWSKKTDHPKSLPAERESKASTWPLVLFLITLIIERIYSFKRRQ